MDYERLSRFCDARFSRYKEGYIPRCVADSVFEAFFIVSLLRKEEKPRNGQSPPDRTDQYYGLFAGNYGQSIVSRFDSVTDGEPRWISAIRR